MLFTLNQEYIKKKKKKRTNLNMKVENETISHESHYQSLYLSIHNIKLQKVVKAKCPSKAESKFILRMKMMILLVFFHSVTKDQQSRSIIISITEKTNKSQLATKDDVYNLRKIKKDDVHPSPPQPQKKRMMFT